MLIFIVESDGHHTDEIEVCNKQFSTDAEQVKAAEGKYRKKYAITDQKAVVLCHLKGTSPGEIDIKLAYKKLKSDLDKQVEENRRTDREIDQHRTRVNELNVELDKNKETNQRLKQDVKKSKKETEDLKSQITKLEHDVESASSSGKGSDSLKVEISELKSNLSESTKMNKLLEDEIKALKALPQK